MPDQSPRLPAWLFALLYFVGLFVTIPYGAGVISGQAMAIVAFGFALVASCAIWLLLSAARWAHRNL